MVQAQNMESESYGEENCRVQDLNLGPPALMPEY